MTNLGTLPGDSIGFASAIDSKGRVAGASSAVVGDDHAVVWTPTGSGSFSIKSLGALPGDGFSAALAINDGGLVAGTSRSNGPERAVAWTPGG